MAQTFTSTEVTTTTNVFGDNQSQRTNENTLRSNFSGATQPSDPVVGQHWYDTGNNKEWQYNGAAWVPIDTNSTTQVDVSNAKGNLTTLTNYLRVAHNDDGTLKTSPATAIDEFKDNALVITYVSTSSFTVPTDLTSIFTTNRKLKVYLSASTAITYVASSSYNSGTNVTTVVTGDAVLNSSVTAVKFSIVQYGEREDTMHTADLSPYALLDSPVLTGTPTAPTATIGTDTTQIATTAFVAAASAANGGANSPGYFSRDIPFYASDKLTIATPNRLWVNIAKKGYILEAQKTFDISADASWDSAATLWQENHDYAVNDVIYPSATKTGYYYRCTTAGKSSAIAPTFPTTLGATYNDGNVVWICELDFTVAANRKGKDFYIYSCIPANGTEPMIVLSANSTVPLRYTADTSRKIGGFHTLCADVGTITGHTLSGYVAGNILPASVWDLKHRPVCSPEGMVFIDGMNVWMGIYFLSSSGTASNRQLATVYNGVIADGSSSPTWNDFDFIETLGKQRMRLPSNDELTVATQGNPQAVAISMAADPNTTGGHVSTSSVRLISNYGIEDGCGVMWAWCRDYFYYSTTVSRGVGGGSWGNGASCGSRCLDGSTVGALRSNYGARAASEPLAV